MLSLEREIREAGWSAESAARAVAIERREIVPVRPELRALLWLGVALLMGGVGTAIAERIDQIGHLALILAIAAAAAACYFFAARALARNRQSLAAEYLLLTGALLLSADVGYAEAQFRMFGEGWRWHLLILAAVHGATAYLASSRLVLSLAIVSLAGFFGVDRSGELFSRGAGDAAARLAAAAAAVAVWRLLEGIRRSEKREFEFPLEQAAFHLGMLSCVAAIFDESLIVFGVIALILLAALGVWHAVRRAEESFLIFAVLYLVFGIDAAVLQQVDSAELAFGWLTVTTPIAIAALVILHRRWKARFA